MFQKLILALLLCLPVGATVTTDSDITGVGTSVPLTTKGDLVGYSTEIIRIPVGSNNLCLVADSAETAGVKWASCSSGSGDVVGPGSSTDNAVARFNGATGLSIQNSGVIIDDSNNVSGMGTLSCGVITQSGATLANTYVALAASTDNRLIRADGAAGQIQGSGITISDADAVSGVGTFSSGVITQSGTTLANTYVALAASTDNRLTRFDGVAGQIQGSGITVSDADAVSGVTTLSTTGDITLADATNDGILSVSGNSGAVLKTTTSGEYKFVTGRWHGANRWTVGPSTVVDGDTFSNPVLDITASSGAIAVGNATLNGAVSIPVTTEASAVGTAAVVASGGVSAAKNIASGGQIWSALDTESGSGTTHTIDFNDGNTTVLDLGDFTGGGAVTLTLSNGKSGGYYCIKIIQETTGGARTITWPAAAPDVKWPGGSTCTLSTGDEAIDLVCGVFDGTDYYFSCRNTYS